MGLLLCAARASEPYYYEKLEKNLWSIQELCYIMYRYPVVIPDGLVDLRLFSWLKAQGMEALSERLDRLNRAGEAQEKLLAHILRAGNYHSEKEIQEFSALLKRLKDMDRGSHSELLGDSLFSMGKYGRAVEAYTEALSEGRSREKRLKLADSYMMVMQYRRAAELYEELYREAGDADAISRLFFLDRIAPGLIRKDSPISELSGDRLSELKRSFDMALKEAEHDAVSDRIRDLYNRPEEEFLMEASGLIGIWKREYRERA